jgi:hypothetical protein
MLDVILISLLWGALAVLPYIFKAGGEGRYRRGAGWYLDTRTSRDVLMKQRAIEGQGHEQGASEKAITGWLISGVGLMAVAVFTWVPMGIYGLSVVIGLFGLVYLLRGLSARRENRWLRRPAGGS